LIDEGLLVSETTEKCWEERRTRITRITRIGLTDSLDNRLIGL